MEKKFHFWALSIGNVLTSGIVFPFQVGKLDFYASTVVFKFPLSHFEERPKTKFHDANCQEWPKYEEFKEFDQSN